jgi:SAM-dependent methyltransferase
MFEREAERIAANLEALPPDGLSPLVNLGSSTEYFRTRQQPWIDRLLFAPLRARTGAQAVEIFHVDLKRSPGVDLVANILSEDGYAQLRLLRPKVVLLCNILEHVTDPALLIERALDILQPGGRLIISVPRSYPHHRDPIDTMFRPTPDQVAAMARGARMAQSEVLPTGYYWDNLKHRPWLILRQIVRVPFPFLGWTRWKRLMKKLYWLVKPYLVTIVVLEKLQPRAEQAAQRAAKAAA